MDFFDNSNWFLTKWLLSSFGAWPFQSSKFRSLGSYTAGFFICSLLIPEMMRIFTVWGNMTMLVECTSTLMLHLLAMVNFINCFSNLGKEEQLLIQIKKHRKSYLSADDAKIFRTYDDRCRRITNVYICYIYFTNVTLMGAPFVPKVFDYFLPLNESRPTQFVYEGEYFVDREAYRYWILIHSWVATPFPSIVVLAFDSLYFHFAEHACSLFSIASQRIEKLGHDIEELNGQNLLASMDGIDDSFISCSRQHIEALKFAHVLETAYNEALFFVLGINMLALSITGFLTVTTLNQPTQAIRLGVYTIAQLIHLYYLSWPGQQLIDHSENMHTAA